MYDGIIDISHHNRVDPESGFHRIKDAGIGAIILKATQGTGYVDPTFTENLRRARAVGLLTGAYHFGTKGNAEAQAKHFYETAKDAGLLVLDWEGNSNSTMTRIEAALFVQALKNLSGRFPVLYSGEAFLRTHVSAPSVFTSCPLWIAKYGKNNGKPNRPPTPPKGFPAWKIWQYTSTGKVDGISGNVDRNISFGNLENLREWWNA